MTQPSDDRQRPRTLLELPVTMMISGREMEAKTANISTGGVFIKLPNPPAVGTVVKLAIDLGDAAVRAFSEVIWVRVKPTSPDRPAGMGLQFRHFQDDGDEVLRRRLLETRP